MIFEAKNHQQSLRFAIRKYESYSEDGELNSPYNDYLQMLSLQQLIEKNTSFTTSSQKSSTSSSLFSFLFSFSFTISSSNKFKLCWDFLVIFSIFWTLFDIPYELSFSVRQNEWLYLLSLTIDLIFIIDTILSFFTTYYEGSEEITNLKQISKRYVTTWFLPDIISIFPFNYFLSDQSFSSFSLIKIFRLFRLIKIIRIARIQHKLSIANLTGQITNQFSSLLTMIFTILFIAHIFACGYNQLALCPQNFWSNFSDTSSSTTLSSSITLLERLECKYEKNNFSLYIISLYWTFATLLTVGYGDVTFDTIPGRLFSICVMFVGNVLFGYMIAVMLEQTVDSNPIAVENQNSVTKVIKYLQKKNISSTISRRLWRHYEYYYTRYSLLNAPNDTLKSCPIYLKKELFQISNSDIIEITMFNYDINIIFELIPFFHPYLMDSNEILLSENEYSSEMYFVINGNIIGYKQNLQTSNKKIYFGIWLSSSHFNADCCMNLQKFSTVTYKSNKITELVWINRSDIIDRSQIIRDLFELKAQEEFQQHQTLSNILKSKSIFKLGIVDHHFPQMIFNNTIIDTNQQSVDEYLPIHKFSQHLQKFRRNGGVSSQHQQNPSDNNLNHDNINEFDNDEKNNCLNKMSHNDNNNYNDTKNNNSNNNNFSFFPSIKYYRITRPTGRIIDDTPEYTLVQESSWMMLQRGIINPQSPIKIYYDFFVMLCTILLLITIPLRYCFQINKSSLTTYYDELIQFIYMFDFVVSFFTAYERPDFTLNTERRDIVMNYLKGWFAIDLLSAFPFDLLLSQNGLFLFKLFKLLRIARITRLLKVLKISRLVKVLKLTSSKTSITDTVFSDLEEITLRLIRGIFVIGILLHILACGWYYITILSNNPNTWYNPDEYLASDIVGNDLISLYIGSIYYVSTTSFTVGYGDIRATNDSERIFSICVMLIGTLVVSFVTSQVVHTESINLASFQNIEDISRNSIDKIRQYLSQQAVSQSLTRSVLKHCYHVIEIKTEYSEKEIFTRMPCKYRVEILTHNYHKIIHQFPSIFPHTQPSISTTLLRYFEPCYCCSQHYLYSYETGSGGYYLLHNGILQIVDEDMSGNEVILGKIHPGKVLGGDFQSELQFLGLRAIEDCQLYYISLANISSLQIDHPLLSDDFLTLLELQGKETITNSMIDYKMLKNKHNSHRFLTMHTKKSFCESLWSWFLIDSDLSLSASQSFRYLDASHETMKTYSENEIEDLLNALKKKSPSLILSTSGRLKFMELKKRNHLMKLNERLSEPTGKDGHNKGNSDNNKDSQSSKNNLDSIKSVLKCNPMKDSSQLNLFNLSDMIIKEEEEQEEEKKDNSFDDVIPIQNSISNMNDENQNILFEHLEQEQDEEDWRNPLEIENQIKVQKDIQSEQ